MNGKLALVLATGEGEFHEALNLAAVWCLPIIFVIENNGYALSTPVSEQYACTSLAERGKGYGMRALQIDGNNVVKVFETTRKFAQKIRKKPKPVLLECMTFRMRGHEEASGTKYVPENRTSKWAKRDPLISFQTYLLREMIIDDEYVEQTGKSLSIYIDRELKQAFASEDAHMPI